VEHMLCEGVHGRGRVYARRCGASRAGRGRRRGAGEIRMGLAGAGGRA
jgi:hypothetical protein